MMTRTFLITFVLIQLNSTLFAQSIDTNLISINIGDTIKVGLIYNPDCHIELQYITLLNHIGVFMTDNPNSKITIEMYTDFRGSAEFNQMQSEVCGKNRIESFFKFQYKNVDQSRFTFRCFGESSPVNNQEKIDNVTDKNLKQIAHSENRRTIFIIQ